MARLGFETVQNVKNYQENIANILGYKKGLQQYRASDILRQEIERLRGVQSILLAQEKSLFSEKSIESYEHLRAKIQEWNMSGADVLLSNNDKIYPIIKQIQDRIQMEEFNKRFSQLLTQNNELVEAFSLEAVDMITPQALKTLVEGLTEGTDLKSFRVTKAGLDAFSGKKFSGYAGILQYIVLIETKTTEGKPVFQIRFKNETPQRYRKRIYEVIDRIGKVSAKEIKVAMSEQTIDKTKTAILTALPMQGAAKQYVAQQLEQNFHSFGFNSSSASIKGALGEIYWTAFWKFISNGRLSVSPVGMAQMVGGGQVPIDIVLKGLGFQVKNYHLDADGRALFRKTMSLEGFLTQRLQMSTKNFEDFYLSWGYNKVIDTEHAEAVYRALFSRFEKIMNEAQSFGLQGLAEARLDRIIRLDSEFQSEIDGQLKLTGGIEAKANVAYLIGDKIVFGSDIIDAIIKQLESGYTEIRFQTFEFDTHEPEAKSFWPNDNNDTGKSLMSGSRVRYEIILDVEGLVQQAINRLN